MDGRDKIKRQHSRLSTIQWEFMKRKTSFRKEGSASPSGRGEMTPEWSGNQAAMQSDDVVLRAFEDHLESISPLPEEEENALRLKSIEEKWQILFNAEHDASYSAGTYVENLRKHTGTARRQSSMRKADGAGSLSYWLRKLKLDLKVLSASFTREFVEKPHCGLTVLVDVLGQIHKDLEKLQSIRKTKNDVLKQAQLDEYECLLCLKFALKSMETVSLLLTTCSSALDMIAMCLLSPFRKTTTAVIEILTAICDTPEGYKQVLDAITMVRLKSMESVRFKLIANMLHSQNTNPHFQAVCVRFFNQLLLCTDNANAKVYLQYELIQAGFEPDTLEKHSLDETAELAELQIELDIWRKNYISVDEQHQELYELQNRNQYLRDEIDRQQKQIKDLEDKVSGMTKEQTDAATRRENLREKVAALQEMLARLVDLYKTRVCENPADEIDGLDDYDTPVDTYATVRGKYKTVSSTSSRLLGSIATVPNAPPLIPPDFLSKTVRHKVETHGNLPTLNWTPLPSIKNTLFEDMDDEAKLREVDFSEFEKVFQLPQKEVEARELGDRIVLPSSKKITFVEHSRARNLVITMKRTNLAAPGLKDAIENFQIDKLPGECAELLLKFIPTPAELKKLAEHHSEYQSLGEAEVYLYQMTKVDRLERKLSLLAFIGKFNDVIEIIRPEMESIRRCSQSLLKSLKLKKIFELILAFGNYMNSNKRGFALGFRLESLSKLGLIKSRDRSPQTLLHYLAQYIDNHYPELRDFGDDLDLCVDKGVSFQSVSSDILSLRKGMEMLRSEREKLHSNDVLDSFYTRASPVVVEMFDSFRRMEEVYQKVCAHFGEKHRDMEPDELVKYIGGFVTAFKKASEENYQRSHPVTVPRVTHRMLSSSTSDLSKSPPPTPSTTGASSTLPKPANAKQPRHQTSLPRAAKLAENQHDESKPLANHHVAKAQANKNRQNEPQPMASHQGSHHAEISGQDKPQAVTSNGVTSNSSSPHRKPDNYKVVVTSSQVRRQEALYDETMPTLSTRRLLYDQSLPQNTGVVFHDIPPSSELTPRGGSNHGNPHIASGTSDRIQKTLVTKDGDIKLKDSYSFYYGAKNTDESAYAKVKKTPSLRDPTPAIGPKVGVKRTSTTPARTQPLVHRVNNTHINGFFGNPPHNHRDSAPNRASVRSQAEPIYEEISAPDDTKQLANGYSPSLTDSASSLSSLQGASPTPARDHRSVDSLGTTKLSATSRSILPSDSEEIGAAIETLDKVLDNALTDSTVASEDEFTSL